jgi:hypothetical protein
MYLAIMLIVVSLLVFYNEINSKMNIAEIALLAIALIAIIRASLNYIQISDPITENFTNNNNRSRKNGVKSRGKNKSTNNTNTTTLNSEDSGEYFDTLESTDISNTANDQTDGKINTDAVNQVNSLLGISKFEDLPTTTTASTKAPTNAPTYAPTYASTNTTTTEPKLDNAIESTFRPQIIIGKGNRNIVDDIDGSYGLNGQMNIANTNILQNTSASWQTAFSDDSMTFLNTMAPSSNLWGTPRTFGEPAKNDSNAWTQSMNDYNNGRWNPQLYKRPSDYTDYYTPSAYGMSTPGNGTTTSQSVNPANANANANATGTGTTSTGTTSTGTTDTSARRCGVYDDLSLDQAGNLVVRNYTEAKKWYPGYTYVPPVYWDVPQRHTSVCSPNGPNYTKLTGLVDRGLPINVLELNQDGTQADTEDTVKLSNVGSIMPQFNYQEQPFSKPYV